jgi:hypothetical protein
MIHTVETPIERRGRYIFVGLSLVALLLLVYGSAELKAAGLRPRHTPRPTIA